MFKKIWNQYRAQANLFNGATQGDIEKIEKALSYGANLERRYDPPGADPAYHGEESGTTALSLALQHDQFYAAQVLIEKGANPFCDAPNMWVGAPIALILEKGKLDLLWLVQEKWNITELRQTHLAPARYGRSGPRPEEKISITDYLRQVNPDTALAWEAMLEKKRLENKLPTSSVTAKPRRL